MNENPLLGVDGRLRSYEISAALPVRPKPDIREARQWSRISATLIAFRQLGMSGSCESWLRLGNSTTFPFVEPASTSAYAARASSNE